MDSAKKFFKNSFKGAARKVDKRVRVCYNVKNYIEDRDVFYEAG